MMSTMRTMQRRGLLAAIVGALIGMDLPATVSAGTPEAVGLFTSVHGSVSVTHPAAKTAPAVVQSDVLFKDIIETDRASRTKALFRDDSLLTMGENTRVEVKETIYDPNHNKRSTVLKLAKGKLRALVGRMFVGSGSRFEIHTTNAVAAARGTYFVVWNAKTRESGIANIGNHGDVAFTSGGKTVIVPPGQYSIAVDKLPPTSPALIAAAMPSEVSSAIQGTEMKDTLVVETSTQVLQAIRGTAGTGSNSGGAAPVSGFVGGASGTLVGTVSGTTTTISETLNSTTNTLKPLLSNSGQLHATLIEPAMETAFRTTSPLMETFSNSGPSIAERLRAVESTVSILPSVVEAVAPVVPPVAIPAAAVELRALIEPVTAVEPKTLVTPISVAAAPVIAVVAPTAVSSAIVEPVSTTMTVTEAVTTVAEPVTTVTEPVTTVTEPITTVTEPITVVSDPLKLK